MNRPLVPNFLKKFDNDLLINKPNIWSTRVHLVVYYSLLFCMAIGLFAFATFNDPRRPMQSEVPMIFTFLISFIGLVVWMIYLLRFNVFKRFGEDEMGNGVKTFLLFFIGFFFLILPNYLPMLIESWKANMKYSSTELVKDANKINELIVIHNKDLVPTNWETDTLILVDSKDKRLENNPAEIAEQQAVTVAVDTVITGKPAYATASNYNYVDKEELEGLLLVADSTLQLNDSVFVTARCPDLEFVSAQKASDFSEIKFKTRKQLYDSIVKGNVNMNLNELNASLNTLINKYDNDYSSYYYDYPPSDLSFRAQIHRNYKVEAVNSGIYNISNKKYTWEKENVPVYLRVIFYLSFILATLLFIFRHSTVRTFFLSVLTVVLLMILTGLILTVTHSSELGVLGLMLFYYFVFLVVLFATQGLKTRTLYSGISLNLVTAYAAYVPLFCVFFFYEYLQNKYRYNYPEGLFKDENNHRLIAEIGGVVLFIILIEPVFKKLYRKWYALPEN